MKYVIAMRCGEHVPYYYYWDGISFQDKPGKAVLFPNEASATHVIMKYICAEEPQDEEDWIFDRSIEVKLLAECKLMDMTTKFGIETCIKSMKKSTDEEILAMIHYLVPNSESVTLEDIAFMRSNKGSSRCYG